MYTNRPLLILIPSTSNTDTLSGPLASDKCLLSIQTLTQEWLENSILCFMQHTDIIIEK